MAASSGGGRCKYCWRPTDCPPGQVMTENRFHNAGCPVSCEALSSWMAEWERGYHHGFNWDDQEYGHIEPWQYRHYSRTYILGYRVGEAEIDGLVELAFQRCYGLEYDE